MTIERKLSKSEVRVFIGLAQQRRELQAAFQEVAEAEQAQAELLRAHFGLPEGQYQVRQEQNGDVVLFRVEQAVDVAQEESPV